MNGRTEHDTSERGDDRVILITGGSRGIGRAIALRLARERPAQIVIAYCNNHAAARTTVQEIERLGVSAHAIPTDVQRPELMQEMFDEVGKRYGRLDVFISNAARATFRPALELSQRAWRKMMDINAYAFLNGAQHAARLMGDRGGKIIGMSSLGSSHAIPSYAGLGAAKAAIESLTRYLAVELAPRGISVNTLSAGFVDTDSMRLSPDYDSLSEYIRSRTPTRRLASPEDLAGIVAFLCSSSSNWLCGQTLVADGGMSLVL